MQQVKQTKVRLGKRVLFNSEQIELEGPSEELLKLTVDISSIPNAKHMEFVTGLTRKLKSIDSRYRKGVAKGGKRVFVGYGKNSKAATFYWVPLYIPNLLKRLRTVRYNILQNHGDILTIGKKRVHIVMVNKIPDLQEEIDELNTRLMKKMVIDGIDRYSTSKRWAEVRDYLASYGISVTTPPNSVYPMRVEHSQIWIEPSVYVKYAEDRVKSMLGKISDEEKAGLDNLKKRMQVKEAEMVKAIEDRFKNELSVFVHLLAEAAAGKPKAVNAKYKKLRQKLVVSGADSTSQVFNVLDDVVDALKSKKADKAQAIQHASEVVAQFLQIAPRATAEENLRLAALALKGDKAAVFLELL
ncbi:MAG: DUF1471 domain-containing protein [Nitrososphaerota archaeon]|jgi:hypothetical protein|nr:DUF1471 domain-containing protein [Nitrososphaerota archaeon]MDG6948659.1 DUF1471 domain-containing protein [Nitrososphaerota archaeon]